jgi:hypothetical protein
MSVLGRIAGGVLLLLGRALARMLPFLLLFALALAGLVTAVFCVSGGTTGISLPHLAGLLHLPALRDTVGHFLGALEAPGPVAVVALLGGLAAMALGALLLVGLFLPRRERLIELERNDEGTLAARRRPLAQAGEALAEQVRGVADAKARARPGRIGGGALSVRATRSRPAEAAALDASIRRELGAVTDPFALKARVTTRLARNAARVE